MFQSITLPCNLDIAYMEHVEMVDSRGAGNKAMLSDQDRERLRGRIDLGSILRRLGETAMGRDTMTAGSLNAARILIDKSLPSLQSIDFNSAPDISDPTSLNTAELRLVLSSIQSLEHDSLDSVSNKLKGTDSTVSGGSDLISETVEDGELRDNFVTDTIPNISESQDIAGVNCPDDLVDAMLGGVRCIEEDILEQASLKEHCGVKLLENIATSECKVKDFPMNGSVHPYSEKEQDDEKNTVSVSEEREEGTTETDRGIGNTPEETPSDNEAKEARPFHRRLVDVQDDSSAGTPDSKVNAPRGQIAGKGVIKGSYIPAGGKLKSGKIR